MIRKIVVPVRGDGKGDSVLRHVAVLAERTQAMIEVIHCRARPEDLLPFGVPIPDFLRKQIVEQSYKVADLEEANLRNELTALARDLDVPDDRITFVEEVGRQVDVIKRHGRLADVIAVPKPDRDRNIGTNTLKAALFHSGRPVLMCPPTATKPAAMGARVTLAWNGSAEAARALASSLPLLHQAGEVVVLSTGGDAGPGTDATSLLIYLDQHGVDASLHKIDATGTVGPLLLSETAALGADMLIMGAYGDSHERETVFGGNTQSVVDTSTLPVLLAH
ncbi:universal stress protein [Actibacterium sp. 188UL27-1]|uniref:universal stress protein n=1 Tax=Actibacterium sp. 188UL27-1 TaxID=2786961 RepID=UPI001956529D|nr:universal stress protein [Actibacterium sp. 188UL27-1]MBM7067410.1 universal stress protein [Actibacterium sp. 188UL27-1]